MGKVWPSSLSWSRNCSEIQAVATGKACTNTLVDTMYIAFRSDWYTGPGGFLLCTQKDLNSIQAAPGSQQNETIIVLCPVIFLLLYWVTCWITPSLSLDISDGAFKEVEYTEVEILLRWPYNVIMCRIHSHFKVNISTDPFSPDLLFGWTFFFFFYSWSTNACTGQSGAHGSGRLTLWTWRQRSSSPRWSGRRDCTQCALCFHTGKST